MQDYAPLLERAFALEPVEVSDVECHVEGVPPDFVRGVYYLNGPGRFTRSGFRYKHWLDGDGFVSALRFEDDAVRFSSRFVRTPKFVAEQDAGRALFRTFGTAFESDQLKRGLALESPANVSVYAFGGKLLAFGEQSLPYELDPVTLETRGIFDFGGQLNDLSSFSAHPKFDHFSGEMFNFGVSFSSTQTILNVYKFSSSGRLLRRVRHRLPFPYSIHDCGLSERCVVFYLSPYFLDVNSFLGQGHSLMQSLRWRPEEGSRLLVVSRESGAILGSIAIGDRFCLHLMNCFEQEGRLYVDLIELDRPVYDQYQPLPYLFGDAPTGGPVRFEVDVDQGALLSRQRLSYDRCPDFPSIDPHQAGLESRDFWMLGISATPQPGRKFFDELVHCNWRKPESSDIYHAPALSYVCGEPAFIANPDVEGEAVIVIQIFDACRVESSFALFNAFDVAAGPIARFLLERPVPLGFHTTVVPPVRGLFQDRDSRG